MIFNSVEYALFLAAVVGGHWLLPVRLRLPLLLAVSYLFYGMWDWRFLSLILASTVVDYSVGRAMPSADDRRRRALLGFSLTMNLGALGVFKYFDFFARSFADLAERVGVETDPVLLDVVLPVGISFYTFQTLAYSIDVYRGKIEPTRDPILFATYVAFFPQLVAGPIERPNRLIPQLAIRTNRPDRSRVTSALGLIALGLFKKVAVADVVARIANRTFAEPDPSVAVVVAGALAFGIQIYFDFSAYTDIARGSSRLLGVELMRNFDAPYTSRDVSEFWRRWHISLSEWLRDYLYIPLGGNRRGPRRTYINLMLTMLLGGLWHGASWNFVIWGALHGAFLAVHRLVNDLRPALGAGDAAPASLSREGPTPRSGASSVPAWALTMAAAFFAWIFFRAQTFEISSRMVSGLVDLRLDGVMWGEWALLGAAVATVAVHDRWRRGRFDAPAVLAARPAVAGALAGLMLVAFVVQSGGAPEPFVYFQF